MPIIHYDTFTFVFGVNKIIEWSHKVPHLDSLQTLTNKKFCPCIYGFGWASFNLALISYSTN